MLVNCSYSLCAIFTELILLLKEAQIIECLILLSFVSFAHEFFMVFVKRLTRKFFMIVSNHSEGGCGLIPFSTI